MTLDLFAYVALCARSMVTFTDRNIRSPTHVTNTFCGPASLATITCWHPVLVPRRHIADVCVEYVKKRVPSNRICCHVSAHALPSSNICVHDHVTHSSIQWGGGKTRFCQNFDGGINQLSTISSAAHDARYMVLLMLAVRIMHYEFHSTHFIFLKLPDNFLIQYHVEFGDMVFTWHQQSSTFAH